MIDKNKVIEGKFTELDEVKTKSFWFDKLPNWLTLPLFIGCLMLVVNLQHRLYSPYVESNQELFKENFELKVFVGSCKCRECKLTLKTIRALYSKTELDSIVLRGD